MCAHAFNTHTHTGCFFRVGAFVFEKVLSGETLFHRIGPHFSLRKQAKMNSS